MSDAQKVERRGGARPNSGPKPLSLSAQQVKKMLRKARKWAKKHGKDVDDILLSFIYASDLKGSEVKVGARDRIACIKLWKEFTVAKLSEGGETDKALGPAVFLPEQRPRLEPVPGGKVA